jgi:hypothetical protein
MGLDAGVAMVITSVLEARAVCTDAALEGVGILLRIITPILLSRN